MKKWIVSDGSYLPEEGIIRIGKLALYSDFEFIKINGVNLLIDGYVLPRYKFFEEYKRLSQYELVSVLFNRYGIDFINRIKGSFNIVIKKNEKLFIANDFHSLHKFFFSLKEGKLIVSNSIFEIQRKINSPVNFNNVALYDLLEHFTCGHTLFSDILFSEPASLIEVNTETLEFTRTNYYSLREHINPGSSNISLDEFSYFWTDFISQYIKFLNPRQLSLTLTGGNDSRMILSALIKKKVDANLFSFGNPQSFDAVVSQKIATKIGYRYNNYFTTPTSTWFKEYADKILSIGNTLINLHRVHRLYAIDQEIANNSNTEMLFCGFMGGDYLKGLSYDNYITPKLFYDFEHSGQDFKTLVLNALDRKLVLKDAVNIEEIITKLQLSPFFSDKKRKDREFNRLFYLVGSMHDYQDTAVFSSRIPYVVNPFMDIDFLEMLYNSSFSFLSVHNEFLFKKFRLGRSSFHLKITDALAPNLSDIEYSKKGYYSANEYLNTNPFFFNLIRLNRFKQNKQYPASFPYRDWFSQYIEKNLEMMRDTHLPYNYEQLRLQFQRIKNIPQNEGGLHIFTNPINVFLNSNQKH